MKKNCVSKALFLAIFVLSVLLSGCSDSSIEPLISKINISGKLSGLLNIPVSGAIVKAGNLSTLTSSSGDFSLQGVSIPYDLRIIDTINKKGFIFKNLTRANFNISLPYMPQNHSITGLNISFPSGIFMSGGKAIFTDGNQFSFYSNIESDVVGITTYPGNNSSITGKVILIFYTKDISGNIISYDRYGVKDSVIINAGITKNVDFSLDDLQFNPGEISVSGNISGLQNYNSYKFFYLTFGKRYSSAYSNELLFSVIQDDYFSLVLPSNLPSDYTPIIYANGISTSGNISQQFVLPKGGTGINLKIPELPSLLNPPDNATDVDTTTQFNWTTGSDNGIYGVFVSDPNPNNTFSYSIYTNSTSTTLTDLYSLGLENLSNRTFNWYCVKYGSVNSLDEQLDPMRNNLAYFGASTSTRKFRTK